MSFKFLDYNGLLYFWGKLKAYFQPLLISGTNIKTINNESLLGSGNISIQGGTETDPVFSASAASEIVSTDITNWNAKADVAKAIPYAVCSTAGTTAQKEVSISNITELTAGLMIAVKFTNANAASSPTLKVNSLDAKSIKRYGTTAPSTSAKTSWQANQVVTLIYDGTYWQMVDWTNPDTTYSSMTVAEYEAGTGTSARLITPARLKGAIEYHAPIPTSTDVPTADTIAEFDSSAHINSEDMSDDDVSDFVDALNTTGVRAVDYVVEEGIYGIWYYRKWNSGTAECWGKFYDSAAALSGSNPLTSGGKYWQANINYPFTFTAAPSVSANGTVGSGYSIVAREYRSTTKCQLLVYSNLSSATAIVDFGFYVIGRWK